MNTPTLSSQSTRRERIQHELTTLAFITRSGNWLFLLLSRLGEPLMFLSVLYVIAETVLPSLFQASLFVRVSNVSVIILNTAPEVILPGCFLQARQGEVDQAWMYRAMGGMFLLLTFITLASFIWQFPEGAVQIILFLRCAAGVLYSLLVRMTPQGDLSLSLRFNQSQLDDLAHSFNQQGQRLADQLSQIEMRVEQRLTESAALLESSLQQQLAGELLPLHECFQRSREVLAMIPDLQAHLQEIERSTREKLHRVNTALETQALSQGVEPHKRGERPVFQASPSVQRAGGEAKASRVKAARQSALQARRDERFDARAFVFSCLEANSALKLAEIEQQALAAGQALSQPTISRYRKQFFASAGSVPGESERALKAESEEIYGTEIPHNSDVLA